MRKTLLLLLLSIMVTGCSPEVTSEGKEEKEVNSNQEIAKEEPQDKDSKEGKEDELPIDPDKIRPEITLLDPDSIGNVYMQAIFTNNTEYPITGYNLTILKKDTNEKTYLGTYDTVMPGEVSPIFESSGPNTQKEEDYEILKLEVVAKTEKGTDLHIDYDFKLGQAEWNEYE